MKTIRKAICLLLSVMMVFTGVPVFGAEIRGPEPLPADVFAGDIAPGAFYLGSVNGELAENGGSRLLLVARPDDEWLPAETVRLVMTDVTAGYGEDYTVREYKGKARVENGDESTSLLDLIREDPELLELHNDTDDLIETGLLPGLGELEETGEAPDADGGDSALPEGAMELTDQEMEAINEATYAYLAGDEYTENNETESPVLDDSLRRAKSALTGMVSDRTPMTNGQSDRDMTEKMIEVFSEALCCAVLDLTFEEGETEKYVEICPKNDRAGNGDRIFNIDLVALSEDAVISDASGIIITILDDEEQEPAVIDFVSSEYRPEEGYVHVELERSGAENQVVSVHLNTEEGTAEEGLNFSGVDADVVFPFGVDKNYVNIPVNSRAIEDEADFTLTLSQPKGAVLGDTASAGVTIRSTDESFAPLAAEANDGVRVDETMSGYANVYNCRHSSDSHADSKVSQCWDNGTEYVKLFADWPTWSIGSSTWVGCDLTLNPTDSWSRTAFYEGLRIRGKAGGSSEDDDQLRLYVDKDGKDGADTTEWVLRNRLDKYTSLKNYDIYFKNCLRVYRAYLELYRDDEKSREFRLYEWAPILRPFDVQLVQAEPLKFYDANGQLKGNDEIGGTVAEANQTRLQLPGGTTGTEGTYYYGDTIDVLRSADLGTAFSKIEGLDILTADGTYSWPLVNGSPASSQHFKLDMDNSHIYYFISEGNWIITEGKDSRSGLYDVTVRVRPRLTYIDTPVKVYGDVNGAIQLKNGVPAGTGSDEHGNYTLYNFHRGDFIHMLTTVNDSAAYTAGGVRVEAQGTAGTEEFICLPVHKSGDPCDGYARFQNLTYSEIRLFPEITERTNDLRVRVDKADAARFFDLGIFKDLTPADCGTYYEYTPVPAETLVAGVYYNLTAVPKEGAAEWVVTDPDGQQRIFCQNTLPFCADRSPRNNVITLKAPSAGKTASLSVDLSVLAQQVQIGGADVYTVPAENALAVMDESHIALLGETGCASFEDLPIPAMGQESYRRICISYGSSLFYRDLAVPAAESGASLRLNPAPYTVNVADGVIHPTLSNVTAADQNGAMSSYVAIDGTKRIFTAYVGLDGVEYSDTAGISHEEHITGITFVVVDPDTGERKMLLPAAKRADGRSWQAEWTLYSGYEDKYAVGDQIWVEMTTDRLVGDGNSYTDEGGQQNPYLQKTVYPLMPSTLVFTTSVPVEQEPEEVFLPDMENVMSNIPEEKGGGEDALPFLKDFGMNFRIGRLKVSFTPHVSDPTKFVASFGIVVIDRILEKNGRGYYDPAKNPDPAVINKIKQATEALGTKTFGTAGGFFSKPRWNVSVGLNIVFKITEDKFAVDSGVIFVSTGITFGYNAYFVVVVVPVYLGGKVDANIMAGGKIYSDTALSDFSSGYFSRLSIAVQVAALVNVDVYAGVGIAGFAGARGGVEFTLNFLYDSSIENMSPVGVQFRIFGKIWIDLLVTTLDYRWELLDPPLAAGYFKDARDAQSGAYGAVTGSSVRLEEQKISQKVLDEGESYWTGDKPAVGDIASPLTTILLHNGYDWADPQLLDMGADAAGNEYGTLLVFVDKRPGSVNEIDGTMLKYSVLSEGIWCEPRVLFDTGTADFQPSLCDMGDSVLVSWISRDPDSDAVEYEDINELLADMDVYTILFSKEDLKADPDSYTRLTDDRYYNCQPQAVCVPDTGDVLVTFQKSEVVEESAPMVMAAARPGQLSQEEACYLTNVLGTTNNCEVAYMRMDGDTGEWIRDYREERRAHLLTAAQADALEEELGGQRFLSTPIRELGAVDPLLNDLDTAAFEKYVLYTFSVDADNDVATEYDRAVYLQVLDTEENVMYEAVRIHDTDVIQCRPQILLRQDENGTEPMLFWLENNEDVCYTGLLPYIRTVIEGDESLATGGEGDSLDIGDQENLFGLGGVFFGSLDPEKKPALSSYRACSDRMGNLYVTWAQPMYKNGKRAGQEIFASAEIVPTGWTEGTAWSEGVRLTSTGRINDQQVITVDGSSRIIVVNNQVDLDLEDPANFAYEPKDIQMVATVLYPTCMLDVDSLIADNDTPVAGETVTVRGSLKNVGLLPAGGYRMKVTDQWNQVVENAEGREAVLVPSGTAPFRFDVTIPDSGELPELNFLLAQDHSSIGAQLSRKVGPLTPFRYGAKYVFNAASVVQEDGRIYLECVVENYGNSADGDGAILNVHSNNLRMDLNAKDTVYLSVPLGDIPAGEKRAFREELIIPDDDFTDGVAYLYAAISDADDTNWLCAPQMLCATRMTKPTGITVPGLKSGELSLQSGRAKDLSGITCKPEQAADNARYIFSVADPKVAAVENGVLRGLRAGSTELIVTVLPSGMEFRVPVSVDRRPGSATGTETEAAPAEPEIDPAGDCPRDGSCSLRAFSDLEPMAWYHDGIEYCLVHSLMKGMGDGSFAPNGETTRGQIVTILYRLEGEPAFMNDNVFTDVEPGSWYEKAVVWANGKDIVRGYGNDTFGPNDRITREQLAAILYRYAQYRGMDVTVDENTNFLSFRDFTDISEYAVPAMMWAVERGLINGDGGLLMPQGTAVRAQAAAVLQRFCETALGL